MFVVYSPEGQAYLGLQSTLPALKAQPIPPVAGTQKTENDPNQVAMDRRYHQVPLSIEQARKAYQQVREAAQARGEPLIEVREIMSTSVITLPMTATLEQAWRLFEERGVGTLPVMDGARVVGLLSVTDLMGHVWRENERMRVRTWPVTQVMSSPVITCWPETLIRRAARVMSDYLIHTLPVVSQGGQLEGMVTVSDIVARLATEPHLELYV
ncbi:MAG TPA: CBS domain-containing protein [Sulfurivirga caldicuralii]|nr:CBS domain-containing protein [Sulfurivirga caldicuralii]